MKHSRNVFRIFLYFSILSVLVDISYTFRTKKKKTHFGIAINDNKRSSFLQDNFDDQLDAINYGITRDLKAEEYNSLNNEAYITQQILNDDLNRDKHQKNENFFVD